MAAEHDGLPLPESGFDPPRRSAGTSLRAVPEPAPWAHPLGTPPSRDSARSGSRVQPATSGPHIDPPSHGGPTDTAR